MHREFKIFKCKVIYQNVNWFEIVEVKKDKRTGEEIEFEMPKKCPGC